MRNWPGTGGRCRGVLIPALLAGWLASLGVALPVAAADPKVIEEEISAKIPIAMEGGGYIYHSDHSVPNDVSFNQYKRVMDLVLKYGAY